MIILTMLKIYVYLQVKLRISKISVCPSQRYKILISKEKEMFTLANLDSVHLYQNYEQ